jgi:MarR family transcriptional regulator for hemolysin
MSCHGFVVVIKSTKGAMSKQTTLVGSVGLVSKGLRLIKLNNEKLVAKKKTKSKSAKLSKSLINKMGETARQSRASFSTRLQDLGLYAGQDRLILILKKTDGLTPSQLAEKLGVTALTIAKSITRLAARGVVVRREDKTDRRRANVYLTNLGHSMVKVIKKENRKWRRKVLIGLESSDKKLLLGQLDQILNNIDKIK